MIFHVSDSIDKNNNAKLFNKTVEYAKENDDIFPGDIVDIVDITITSYGSNKEDNDSDYFGSDGDVIHMLNFNGKDSKGYSNGYALKINLVDFMSFLAG